VERTPHDRAGLGIADFFDEYRPKFDQYRGLMPRRVRQILLVSSLYDAFIMEEDGSLIDQIWDQYVERRITLPPTIQRVSSVGKALERIEDRHIDLVLAMTRLSGGDPVSFATKVKERRPELPVVLLATDPAELAFLPPPHRRLAVDKVFLWRNDSQIFLSIIKLVEDLLNVDHDTSIGNVRVILLIEDSVARYSAFLPLMYTELMNLTRNLIDDGLNDLHKQLRMRSRAKILHAESFEVGMALYERHSPYMLGVISDVSFWRGGRVDPDAGYDFISQIKREKPHMPVLLQSAEAEVNAERAWSLGASFLDKNAPNMLMDVRGFLKQHMGFGDFVFRTPDGIELASSSNVYELLDALKTAPIESVIYHAEHNHFSNWLAARTEMTIADEIGPRRVAEFASHEEVRAFIVGVISRVLAEKQSSVVAEFSRRRKLEITDFMHLGSGSMGGKGRGIAFVRYLLTRTGLPERFPGIRLDVPPTLVLGAGAFEEFVGRNDLLGYALSMEDPWAISDRFQGGEMDRGLVEDLRSFVATVDRPLAVRSSSILEDSHTQPFAGLYATCMVPNTSNTMIERLDDLVRAIKLVWASTYFPDPKAYFQTIGGRIEEEKMAVVIQEVVGNPHGNHFYPTFSGVAQSHNFYPVGPMRPEDGIAQVALGLGKTIVEGGKVLRFCPAHPKAMPHISSAEDWLEQSQKEFYALRMDRPFASSLPCPDANLDLLPISRAEEDGELAPLASVYSVDDRIVRDGLGMKGQRVLTFAGILKSRTLPMTEALRSLLETFTTAMGCPIEMEFAVDMDGRAGRPDFIVLQLRPLNTGHARESVEIGSEDRERAWLHTTTSLGNGVYEDILDVVYVPPARFDRSRSRAIASEVGRMNEKLTAQGRPYILVGFGRWGTTDPWLGIGTTWAQISGARVIVEASLPDFSIDPSQGTHFFHNMTSLGMAYLSVRASSQDSFIDWQWLESQPVVEETPHLRHARLSGSTAVKIDGREGLAVALKPEV
jgi:hypothetical protein